MFYIYLVETVALGGQADIIHTDFHVAFDKADQCILFAK